MEYNHCQLLLNNQELNIIRSVIECSIGFDYQSFSNRTFDCVRWEITILGQGSQRGGYLTKFNTGRLHPEIQPFYIPF